MARVTATSSGDGVGSWLGWLCRAIIAGAMRWTAGLKISPTRTWEEFTLPW
jgi:hypothetical protein